MGHELDTIAKAVGRRDPAAFRRLHGVMADRLFAFALRMLHDRQAAEDAVQQAFLELLRAESSPSEGRSLEAWLFSSVRFSGLDEIRRRERRPETPVDRLPERDGRDQYELGLDIDLERALGDLNERQRMVVHLKHVEGLDGEQIAQIVGMSRGAVYATASRAERRLKRALQPSPTSVPPGQWRGGQ